MIEIFQSPNYNFIGKRKWAYAVSIVITLVGLISLATHGLRYDIDFTGGTLVQVRFEHPVGVAAIRANLGKIGLAESVIQQFGDPREFILRMPLTAEGAEQLGRRVQTTMSADPALGKFEIRRADDASRCAAVSIAHRGSVRSTQGCAACANPASHRACPIR